MQGMTKIEHMKMETVKKFLNRYIVAKENMRSISELNTLISEELTNPSIGGRGYTSGSDSSLVWGGAGATVAKSDVLSEYGQQQAERNKAIMKEVEDAISLLDVTRGKTIIEKRHLGGLPWRYIEKAMNLGREQTYRLYKQEIFILYDRMTEHGLIQPI